MALTKEAAYVLLIQRIREQDRAEKAKAGKASAPRGKSSFFFMLGMCLLFVLTPLALASLVGLGFMAVTLTFYGVRF